MKCLNHILYSVVFLCSCVSPPEYTDGLLENIVSIMNEQDYFSLSIYGDDYSNDESWDLELSINDEQEILTTLVVNNLNISSSDSTFLIMLNQSADTVLNVGIFNNITFSSRDSVVQIGVPKQITLRSKNFSGRLDFQLLRVQ